MAISFVRIDDRVIHGQTMTRWATQRPLNAILVISDAVAGDELRKKVLRAAAGHFKIGIINGIVASMEEDIALGGETPNELPVSIKTTLMGPLAGLGDSVIQGIIVPTLLSIGMSIAADGSAAGPLFYIVSWLIIGMGLSYGLFRYGYKMGLNALDIFVGENSRRIMDAINVVGIIITGTLAASMISVKTIVQIPMGSEMSALQDTLNGVFPGLLALITVLFTYWMLNKKQYTATKTMLILVVAVIVLCAVTFL
jgi:mannose/fructose/N-acetylgalactosamine-specific phosphotransferase system component IID